MEKEFKNTTLWILLTMTSLLCWTVSAADSAPNKKPGTKWTITHNADGATRFEFNTDQQNYYYELKLLGFEIDGGFEKFEAPRVITKSNRITKQWATNLKEIWFKNNPYDIFTLQIEAPTFVDIKPKQLKLKYSVDSNFEGWFSVGGNRITLQFEDIYNQPKNTQIPKPDISASFSIYDTSCELASRLSLTDKGIHEISINLQNQSFPMYVQAAVRENVGYENKLTAHTYTAQVSDLRGQVKMALHQEVREQGKLKHQIRILEQNTFGGWQEYLLNDWPITGKCKYTGDEFASSMAIEGDWLVVSDSHDCEVERVSGALFVFHKSVDGWQFHSKLKTKDVYRHGGFGQQLVLENGVIYADSENNYLQQIHVFKFEGKKWQEQPGIVINGRSQASGTMSDFKVNNDLLVIGMQDYLDPENFTHQSAGEALVYRYEDSKWRLEASLKPQLAQGDDYFGDYVAVGDGVIAVAATELPSNTKGQAKGAVHMFEYESGVWQVSQVIRPEIEALEINVSRRRFITGLELSESGLFIQDQSLRYQTKNMNDLPDVCAFVDGSGAIYHHQKIDKNWQLFNTIKLQDNSGSMGDAFKASDDGLYFLSKERTTENQIATYLNHYSNGEITWKHQTSNPQ